jgi:outer membrane lipoprotein SlyB
MTMPRDERGESVTAAISARTVVGLFDTFAEADAAAGMLRDAGFRLDDVSVVARPPGTPPQVKADDTQSHTSSSTGAVGGAVLGALAALAIPGIGPVLAVGPIAAALAGAVGGATIGGFVGSFMGLNIPTDRADAYEAHVRQGGVFVAVHTPDADTARHARAVLEQSGARDTSDYQTGL